MHLYIFKHYYRYRVYILWERAETAFLWQQSEKYSILILCLNLNTVYLLFCLFNFNIKCIRSYSYQLKWTAMIFMRVIQPSVLPEWAYQWTSPWWTEKIARISQSEFNMKQKYLVRTIFQLRNYSYRIFSTFEQRRWNKYCFLWPHVRPIAPQVKTIDENNAFNPRRHVTNLPKKRRISALPQLMKRFAKVNPSHVLHNCTTISITDGCGSSSRGLHETNWNTASLLKICVISL
jgi:hypothetical protein